MPSPVAHADFFDAHTCDIPLLAGLALFPRLTLLFVGGPFGVWQWLGWFVCPHLLVAILATTRYWDTDPLLCVFAWFFAFVGTGGEGRWARRLGTLRPPRRRDDDDDAGERR